MADKTIFYIFHHVFLPPKLPQSDDFSVHNETALVSCVLDCLVKFKNHVSEEQSAAVQSAIGLIQAFIRVHSDLGDTTAVGEFGLCEVLRDLDYVGGVVPLHIRAQNAGVLITKTISDMHIETFELSPENKAVVSTIGRLRRCFPGSAIATDLETTYQEGFIENLAATLAQMSSQSAPDTQPLVKKAGQLHQEIRDTTHPKIVTELLNAYLLALGRPLPGTRLWKNTREEVLWSNCYLPWRRSPTWLLIRVALQLVFGRRCAELGLSEDLYKIFMLFLVAEILNQSLEIELPSETLILMNAKVSRRLHKLEGDREGLWLSHVRQTMCRANEILAARWSAIQQRDAPPLNLDRLRTLDFEKDTVMHLPELDQFLAQLCHRQKTTEPCDFTPSWALVKNESNTIPKLNFEYDREHLTLNLESFEIWVEKHLENWLQRRMDQKDTDACAELRQLIEGYHLVASDFYLENPEETSIMLLTILELWIACDKMAVVLYPMLLEYDPGIPNDIFENFLLPLRQQMARLHRAELYVHCRSKQSRFPAPNIYTDFGSQNSFSVRYFNQSTKHQNLLNGIQAKAQRDRDAKHAEFERLQAKYQSIMREYNQLSCTYETYYSHKLYQNVTRHSGSCKKHRCLEDAKNVVIQIHEWPLPPRQLEAKSVVFELSLPSSFGYWREATVFALFSVFRVKQHGGHNPRNRYTLGNYQGLSEYFSRNITSQHVYLLSQDKPHTVTHRRSLAVGTASTFQVCLNNALHYEFYNEYRSSMLTGFDPTQEIPRRCTYKMPEQSSSLDRFLFRPASGPNGPTPNTVIATQSNCPDQMALDEYKALCSIPLGFRLQWSNILVQLFSPSVDFRKSETRLATLQCIYQAGPSCGDLLRGAHKTFEDVTFCEKLLEGLDEATLRFEQNWQSSIALCTFISIAIRLLSLTTCSSIRSKCFEYLEKARRITFAWACILKDKAQNSSGETERLLMQKREMEFALICSETFNVDDAFRSNVLSNSSYMSIFIQCAIMIHESCHSHLKTLGTPLQHLYSRWQRNCLHSYQVLLERIIIQKSSALDDAVSESWSEYKPSDQWRILSHRHGCWLTTSTGVLGETLPVHYCLVTGELLVNGMPLDHLPSQYLQHPIYAALFGRLSLEVMPTSVAGLKFSSRRLHAGHSIHLGMETNPREPNLDLLVQARNKDSRLELIPHKYLQGKFPIDFVENYIHWYNYNDSYVEFCDISTPWTHSATNWQLRHFNDTNVWKLVRGEISLVNIKSPSARLLGSLLKPLEDSSRIHISYHSRESSLLLDLPRRRLDFSLKSRETLVRSRQFRGMSIDENQAIGTLIGLRDKLILKHDKPRHSLLSLARKVLVPEGTVSYRKAADHVEVTISKDESSRVLAYEVDHELGRIISSSRQSKLFIAYLHALTSFGLPDPLTRQSGTESSLSILTSASIMSIDWLTTENVDILRRLALLAPGRAYYPSHERVMQTVTWSRTLGCLAQHNLFLEYVVSVFKIAERSKLFHPEVYVEPPHLDHVVPELLKRDSIRSSTFRVSGFGAECHEVDYDIIYKSRDTSESSQKARAFQIGRDFHLGLISLFQPRPVNLENHLWTFLASCPKILGHDKVFKSESVMYSSDLILGSLDYIKKNWILLHRNLHAVNRFRTMIWIVTLSFFEISDIHILQMLVRFHTDTTLLKVSAPSADSFKLSKGAEYGNERIRSAVKSGFTSYGLSTERFLARYDFNDDSESLQKLRNQDCYSRRTACQNHVVSCLRKQWPSRTPLKPAVSGSKDIHKEDSTAMTAWPNYIDWNVIKGSIKNLFESWFDNGQFKEYLGQLAHQSPTHDVPTVMPSPQLKTNAWTPKRKPGFLGYDEVFERNFHFPSQDRDWILSADCPQLTSSPDKRLSELLETFKHAAKVSFERQYLEDLKLSFDALLASVSKPDMITRKPDDFEILAVTYFQLCRDKVDRLYKFMVEAVFNSKDTEERLHTVIPSYYQRPRHSPMLFLQRLNKDFTSNTSNPWKDCITEYGIALTQLQRAERMLSSLDDIVGLSNELRNPGHTNWNPRNFPDTLLMEVETGIMVREVQEDIANNMRDPPLGKNAVMQLNMGEGKSSVIVPIVAAALADGSRLVRVIVAKPQSKQMLQMLDLKLGGLLNRRIFHLPFTRTVKIGMSEAKILHAIFQDCVKFRGVMLLQPEHILSFQLMGIESAISGRSTTSHALLQMKHFLDQRAQDIVDESDENFSVKFELVYTMGTQRPVEYSPSRWVCIHNVLDIFRRLVPEVEKSHPKSVEVVKRHEGSFPRTRIISESVKEALLHEVAKEVSQAGTVGLPIATQPKTLQQAVFNYISKATPSHAEIEAVESSIIWSASTKDTLLLLRGLIGCQILAFVFCQKRWRVDFGLDHNRSPRTRLAVPYRAKDNPAPRAEFSHPEIIIILTSLCYYYEGLTDEELFLSLKHLLLSDQADMEYRAWVSDSDKLPLAFHQVSGVNLEDRTQCIEHIFPSFRFSKSAVDYFLAHVVFTKELKEFPHKLSASGWDIGETKAHPTTGFSGTCDARAFLPFTVTQLDLPDQRHTNALVMTYLLQEENSVELMSPSTDVHKSDAEALLETVIKLQPPVRVILDVGAQILELDNVGVAKRWLEMMDDTESTQAVIFCDENDHISVIDRKGRIEPLHTSPFLSRTDVCLVFLDEAHTRGTDLKLPKHYRAAVTLGANLTKDRLVQACMRMRQLGKGQTVVFCVPDEIRQKMMERFDCSKLDLTVEHILKWAISDTWIDIQRGIWLWANQGRRHQRHAELWKEALVANSIVVDRTLAEKFLEDEAQSLERRYKPDDPAAFVGNGTAVDGKVDAITERLLQFGGADPKSATFREEQERELSPEIEQEREVRKPPDATPATHSIHPDIQAFISSGLIQNDSEGCIPAFQALAETSASRHFDTKKFPSGLLVTKDFARTILPFEKGHLSDIYQRSVQWILTTKSYDGVIDVAMIISPFEAQKLLPSIQKSGFVSLHLYAPRPNTGFRALDSLDLYTIPRQPVMRVLPRQLVTELNLFAGQMYADSFEEYLEIRQFLGFESPVDKERSANGQRALIVGPNGDAPFDAGLIQFMKVLMMKIRRNCESIDKTHIGRILDQQSLSPSDFDSSCN